MTQNVYTVAYATDGSFLLSYKRPFGYYFGDGKSGTIAVTGQKLAGGGNYALPGGPSKDGESISAAAERKFHEQLAVPLPSQGKAIEQSFAISATTYSAGYFRLNDGNAVASIATQGVQALANGDAIAFQIQMWKITSYAQIEPYAQSHELTPWPGENALQTAMVRNVLDPETWRWIQTWQNPASGLDTYYYILAYLRNDILGASKARGVRMRGLRADRAEVGDAARVGG